MSSTTLQTFDLEALNSRLSTECQSNPHSGLKSAYISLIIGPRGLGWQTNTQEIMGWESSGVVGFDLGPLLEGQTRIAKLKTAYNSLIIGARVLGWETNL